MEKGRKRDKVTDATLESNSSDTKKARFAKCFGYPTSRPEHAALPRKNLSVLSPAAGFSVGGRHCGMKLPSPRPAPMAAVRASRDGISKRGAESGSSLHLPSYEWNCDRPGLLHDLTRTLAAANVYIANAAIAT